MFVCILYICAEFAHQSLHITILYFISRRTDDIGETEILRLLDSEQQDTFSDSTCYFTLFTYLLGLYTMSQFVSSLTFWVFA